MLNYSLESLKFVKTYINYETLVYECNLMMNDYYVFNNEMDMERCSKPYKLNKSFKSPNGDGEWVYQISRMEFLHKFTLMYALTNEEKYKNKFFDFLDFFYVNKGDGKSDNPKTMSLFKKLLGKIHIINKFTTFETNRTLDTSIRCYSILIDLQYFGYNANSKIYNWIFDDIKRTENEIRDFDKVSNWGIIILSLCSTCRLIMDNNDIDDNINKLIAFLNNQINENGSHIECSTMYQMNCLIALLRLIFWSSKRNIDLPIAIYDITKKMVKYMYYMSNDKGILFQYGDSDAIDTNSIVYIANFLFGGLNLPPKGNPRDYYFMMEFDFPFPENFTTPKQHNYSLLFGGQWACETSLFSLRAFNEWSPSSHKHADNGQVLLRFKGEDVLIDSGRYTYRNGNARKAFRSPFYHNVFLVSGGGDWRFLSPNHFANKPLIIGNKLSNSNSFKSIYYFDASKTTYARTVLVKNEFVVIISECFKKGKQKMRSFWNIPIKFEQVTRDMIKTDNSLYLLFSNNIRFKKTKRSQRYNELEDSYRIVSDSYFDNYGLQICCLSNKRGYINIDHLNNVVKIMFGDSFVRFVKKNDEWVEFYS